MKAPAKINIVPSIFSKKVVNPRAEVAIRQLPSGVRGLDGILGGGTPEFPFKVIAGTK